jgi:sugar O-acyltransferase (sialic acid O-acetyltransferase NeuD family)
MAKPELVVLGASGNAADAFEMLEASHEVIAFIDDAAQPGRTFHGLPVLPRAGLARFPAAQVLCLIGSERTFRQRAEIIAGFGIAPERFATIVHPRASVSADAVLGRGVAVLAGVVIPSNARIGDHVLILPNTVVHHDAVVGECAIIGSNVVVAGGVEIGASAFVGSGATIKNGVAVGAASLIGMAANVVRSCPPGSVLVGNPARPLVRPTSPG